MHIQVYVVIVISVIPSICATLITTIVNRNELGDYFNTSESCSSYSAKDDTIDKTCICKKDNPGGGGSIGGTFLSNCMYDFTVNEGCTMTLLNEAVPYYMKSTVDLSRNTPLSLDTGRTAITTSQCRQLTINANDVWDTVNEEWVGFLADRFNIVQNGINYVIEWVNNEQPSDEKWKNLYEGEIFRVTVTCVSDSSAKTTRKCLIIKVKGSRAYEIPGPPQTTTTTTTTTTTATTTTTTTATTTTTTVTSTTTPFTTITTTQTTPSTTTPISAPSGPNKDDDGGDIGVIVGSIFGVLIGLILIFVLLCFLHKIGKIKISPVVDRIPHTKTRRYFQERDGEEKQGGCRQERTPTAPPNQYTTGKLSKDVESGEMASEEALARMRIFSQSSFASSKPMVTPTKGDEWGISTKTLFDKNVPKEDIYEEIPDPEKEQKQEDAYATPERSPVFPVKHGSSASRLAPYTIQKQNQGSVKSITSTGSGWSLNEFDNFTDDEQNDETDGATGKMNGRRESYLKAEDADEILNELEHKHNFLPDLPDIKNEALPDLPSIKNDELPELPKFEVDDSAKMPSIKTDALPEIPTDETDNDKDMYIDFDAVDDEQNDIPTIVRPPRSLQTTIDGNQVGGSPAYRLLNAQRGKNDNYQGLTKERK